MAETTGIFDDHCNVTKVRAVPHCWFNPDFHRDADNHKCINAAIAQRNVERRAFKCRHCDLVEYGFARKRIHLWDQVKSRRIPQEEGLDLLWRRYSLPCHRHAELKDSHEFLREGHMAREEDTTSGLASRLEHSTDFIGD